jgi:hypothetical protein
MTAKVAGEWRASSNTTPSWNASVTATPAAFQEADISKRNTKTKTPETSQTTAQTEDASAAVISCACASVTLKVMDDWCVAYMGNNLQSKRHWQQHH